MANTIQGKPIEVVFENSLGYFAITGKDLTQRTYMLTKQEYETHKKG